MRTKRIGSILIGALVALSGLAAGSAEPQATIEEKLAVVLAASAQGNCATEIMAPALADACDRQLDKNRNLLSSLGSILNVIFLGQDQSRKDVKGAIYSVEFEKGTMNWYASPPNEAGKFTGLWSNGEVQPTAQR